MKISGGVEIFSEDIGRGPGGIVGLDLHVQSEVAWLLRSVRRCDAAISRVTSGYQPITLSGHRGIYAYEEA